MTRGSYNKSEDRTLRVAARPQDERRMPTVTDPGLLTRTSWTNASVALLHIKKVSLNMTLRRRRPCGALD
jgi:hypothetical protein